MNIHSAQLTVTSDDELCQQSRDGDREAFGHIVERYQSLICSLAYSACGNLSHSEDLAQETFVTAWQRLGDLREPSKLRAWLCGIVRNLTANTLRREKRRGVIDAPLDGITEPAASECNPATHAVTREEETLLWRSLATLPETYREPMVLFYRQGQSINEVATALELSEDAVKQRLSRGRSLLRDELAAVVEKTLTRTRPTSAFTLSVLAVLPAAASSTAKAAVLGAVSGQAAGAAKGLLANIGSWTLVGPAIGLLIGLFSSRAAASTARSPEERACLVRYSRRIVIFCWLMSIGLAAVLYGAGKFYPASPLLIVVGVLVWTTVLVGAILAWCSRIDREVLRIRAATGTEDQAYGEKLAAQGLKLDGPWLYESKLRVLGLPLIAVACGGMDAGISRTRKAVGWIAIGDVAISPLIAMGGFAVAPFALGAITVGLLSLSLWGLAFGGLAVGCISVGWWAFGMGAIGWQSAAGAAVVAKEYALGALAQAGEANTPAVKEWFLNQWFVSPVQLFLIGGHILIVAIIAFTLGRLVYRSWQLRKVAG